MLLLRSLSLIAGLALLQAAPARAACDLTGLPSGTEVAELETALGSLCIELLVDDAPLHVDNFLFYLENDLLVDTFFHRSVPGFIVQGAGFTLGAGDYEVVPPLNGAVPNEPCTLDIPDPAIPGGQICSVRGNERGTVALAKLGGDPDSGTTNWFVNLTDNRSNLDNQNGGFTVFGRLVGGSIAVADAMAALPRASQDDLAWMESAFQTSPNFPVPLLAPPLDTPSGCWDRAQESTALVASQLPALAAWADPILEGLPPSFPFPFQLSAACGTAIPTPSGPADLPADGCASSGGVAVRVTGPFSLLFPGGTPSFVSFTCAQVQESLDQRALWLAAYRQHFNQQLVFIEAASVATVPNAVPMLSTPATALLGAGLLAAGLRGLARRRG